MFSVQETSLKGNVIPELYIPLWWESGTVINASSTIQNLSRLKKGINVAANSSTSEVQLHTLNPNWSADTDYALEVSCSVSTASNTGTIALYDFTSDTEVPGSRITTAATMVRPLRSGKFKLTPGHAYGVTLTSSNSSYSVYVTDASLLVFPPSGGAEVAGVIDLSIGSIAPSLSEVYIPLWISSVSPSTRNSNVNGFVQKGTTTTVDVNTGSAAGLLQISTEWGRRVQFALEAVVNLSTVGTGFVSLWDITDNKEIAQISTTSTVSKQLRSVAFNLIPGHVYGLSIKNGSGTVVMNLTRARLVAFA